MTIEEMIHGLYALNKALDTIHLDNQDIAYVKDVLTNTVITLNNIRPKIIPTSVLLNDKADKPDWVWAEWKRSEGGWVKTVDAIKFEQVNRANNKKTYCRYWNAHPTQEERESVKWQC